MKLPCSIEVNSRLLASVNLSDKRKPARGCLSIARQSVKNNDLYLLLQTAQNKQGTKYKVDQNIEHVFTKFVNDGKATIRIKEPSHDLIIQADVIMLKSFLRVLKLGLSKQIDPSILSISNMNPKTLTVHKTKVVIKKNSEYPVLQGFPVTTESLYLSGLQKRSFDRQILKLQSLRILDLSENQLTSLPNELGSLPRLSELYLASNLLGKANSSKWSWMSGPHISKNLRLLDISHNCLEVLPDQIRKLSALVTLKIGNNSLKSLPQSIGSLMRLKYFEMPGNSINFLPGSMRSLRLDSLDVSHNPFNGDEQHWIYAIDVPTLIELGARVVTDCRIHYDAQKIPRTLVKYLDEAIYCVCGKSCFETYIRRTILTNLHAISGSVKLSGRSEVPFDCYFCSMKCAKRHSNILC